MSATAHTLPESADGTMVQAATDPPIIDMQGNAYHLAANGELMVNGRLDSSAGFANTMLYTGRYIWLKRNTGVWYNHRHVGDPWQEQPASFSPWPFDHYQKIEALLAQVLANQTAAVTQLATLQQAVNQIARIVGSSAPSRIVLDLGNAVTATQPAPTRPGP